MRSFSRAVALAFALTALPAVAAPAVEIVDPPRVLGAVDNEEVRSVIRDNLDAMDACFAGHRAPPSGELSIAVRFSIAEDGAVGRAVTWSTSAAASGTGVPGPKIADTPASRRKS